MLTSKAYGHRVGSYFSLELYSKAENYKVKHLSLLNVSVLKMTLN